MHLVSQTLTCCLACRLFLSLLKLCLLLKLCSLAPRFSFLNYLSIWIGSNLLAPISKQLLHLHLICPSALLGSVIRHFLVIVAGYLVSVLKHHNIHRKLVELGIASCLVYLLDNFLLANLFLQVLEDLILDLNILRWLPIAYKIS